MVIKLLDNWVKALFWGLIIVESIAFWMYLYPSISSVAWIVLVAITLVLSLKKLEYGLYIILAELFFGSHGHLFDLMVNNYKLSIRIGLFMAVFIAMVYWLIKNKKFEIFKEKIRYIYYIFFIIVLFGIVQGIAKFGLTPAFFDFNGYLFFLLLPAFLLVKSQNFLLNTFKILLIVVNWVFIKTFVLLYIFSHQISWLDLSLVYKFIRDTRIGEITYVTSNFYRVFMQSQVYSLVAFIGIVIILIVMNKHKIQIKDKWYLYLTLFTSSITILASFSRSNWLGAAVTVILLALFYWFHKYTNFTKLLKLAVVLILLLMFNIGFLFTWTGSWQPKMVSDRVTDVTESAATSRQSQLKPLWYQINKSLIVGNGFGQTITYQTEDPRIKNDDNPTGRYTTYAFEWGYLDIWLKVGFLGLIVYLAILTGILRKRLKIGQNEADLPIFKHVFAFGLLSVVIISIFSPYLNHPLGIGLILINIIND